MSVAWSRGVRKFGWGGGGVIRRLCSGPSTATMVLYHQAIKAASIVLVLSKKCVEFYVPPLFPPKQCDDFYVPPLVPPKSCDEFYVPPLFPPSMFHLSVRRKMRRVLCSTSLLSLDHFWHSTMTMHMTMASAAAVDSF